MALNLIYTILWCVYFVITAPIHVALATIVRIVSMPWDPQRRTQCSYSRFIQKCLVGASVWLKVDVSGMEHIDKQKTYIIVCNHQSMLDILFLYKIPLSFKWVSKREVYKIPLVGILVWLHRDVTVKRGDASSARKMISECSKWLQQGISMVIFAEGTRSKDGRVAEFKEGAFVVATNK